MKMSTRLYRQELQATANTENRKACGKIHKSVEGITTKKNLT